MQVTPKKSFHSDSDKYSERFIPNRASSNLISSFDKIQEDKNSIGQHYDDTEAAYSVLLQRQFSSSICSKSTLFKFRQPSGKENSYLGLVSSELYTPLVFHRKIPKSPYKVLDAPALVDDFYLNLLDWSVTNHLIVGLGSCVYIWNATTSKVTKLCDLGLNDSVTSVSSSPEGSFVTVGSHKGNVMLWDFNQNKLVRQLHGHSSRVGTLAWNSSIVSSGSRDRLIFNRDIRMASDLISRLTCHKQEVCGLKWSYDQQQLSSGGNDNKLILWNLHSNQPVNKLSAHSAAVKALAWSPHQYGLLASGGGTADKTIRYWNTHTGEQIACIDTGSQVCNLIFSKNTHEVVSTHGYSMNQIVIWKDYNKIATLTGHSYRVLYLAISPDGQNIVTGAGDETLRFWEVFPYNGFYHPERSNSLLLSPFDVR